MLSSYVAFSGGNALYAGEDEPADLTKPFDVEIGLSGQYKTRGFELSSKQFDEMIANHQAAGVDPAVDREHESWFGQPGQPALGWVRGLRVRSASGDARRKALVASVQLNDVGQNAVKQGHFRYVSMGFDKAGKNRMTGEPIGAVLDHLALVKNPFIQGMRPLSLALSAQLGRLVDEEPMEKLSAMLIGLLGLSADAPEEKIMSEFEAFRARAAQKQTDEQKALAAALDEQKRVNARLEDGMKALAAESEARTLSAWKLALAAKVAEFTISPAESAEFEKLSGAERGVVERLLALRAPGALKPAAPITVATKTPGMGTTSEGLSAAQVEAIAAYQKSNPTADDSAALTGAALANPSLFSVEA